MSEYFPEPEYSAGKVKIELDLPNYATKADAKNATGIETWKFAIKNDLTSLKLNIDKLDIGKLKNVPVNLSHLKIK